MPLTRKFDELLPAGAPEGASGSSPPLETRRCQACGQNIPDDRYELHAKGLDGARPECPLTDLVEVAKRAWANPGGMPYFGMTPWTS